MAVDHVNAKIAPAIIGMNIFDQAEIDEVLIQLDGTKDKSNLGANTILGVSMAVARSAAASLSRLYMRILEASMLRSFRCR